MKITKETLKKIIKEEVDKVLKKEASETTGQMLQRTAEPVDKEMRKLLDAFLTGEETYLKANGEKEDVPRYLYTKHPDEEPEDGIKLPPEQATSVLERGGMERIVEAYVIQP